MSGYANTTAYVATVVMNKSVTANGDYTTTMYYLQKTSGAFTIPHPNPAKNRTHALEHRFVESPTAGDNIYRYRVMTTDCAAVMQLPDYFKYLNKDVQVHVQSKESLIDAHAKVTDDKNCIEVRSLSDGSFDLFVFATRDDKVARNNWKGPERLIENEEYD